MNKRHILIGLAIVLTMPAAAGWRTRGDLQTPSAVVTLSSEELSNNPADWLSLTQSLSQAIALARSRANTPLDQERFIVLRGLPPFQGLDDSAIQNRFQTIHTAIVASIELIGMEKPSAAESVVRMITTGRFGLGFGGKPGLSSELREDGSGLVGDEALNLYQFPISSEPIPKYSIDMYRLTSTLAREGFRMENRGFTSFAPISSLSPAGYLTNEAMAVLQTQWREMEAAREGLVRLDSILSALNGIVSSGEIPPDSKGIAAGIGHALVRDPILTLPQKQNVAGELRGYLRGIEQPKAFMDLEYRTAYYRSADAWLKGQTSQSQSVTAALRDSAYFHYGIIQPSRPLRYVSYMVGYWSHPNVFNDIQLDPQTFPAIIPAGNEVRQIGVTADGLSRTQRVFNVTGLKNITGATIWGSSLWLAGNSPDNVNGAIWAYKDSDNDGLFDEATASKAIEFTGFNGGIAFGRNTMEGFPFLLNRSMGDLYRLDGILADKPTTWTQYGRISSRTDLREFGFSGNYVYGVNDWDSPLTRGMRWSQAKLQPGGSQFVPLGDHFDPFTYAEVTPALGSGLRAGAFDVFITGTIGRDVTAYDINGSETALGTIKIDPAGRGVFHLGTALTEGHGVRFLDDKGLKSTTYKIPPVEPLRFGRPETLPDGTLLLQAFGMPDRPYTHLSGTSLNGWEEDDCVKSSRFGSFLRLEEPAGAGRF
jgi:hypothetical protein